MSEVHHFKARITEVKLDGGVENTSRLILEDLGDSRDDDYESWSHQLAMLGDHSYAVTNDKIFKIEITDGSPYLEIHNASANDDGTIDLEVLYHTGSTTFCAVVQKAIDKL